MRPWVHRHMIIETFIHHVFHYLVGSQDNILTVPVGFISLDFVVVQYFPSFRIQSLLFWTLPRPLHHRHLSSALAGAQFTIYSTALRRALKLCRPQVLLPEAASELKKAAGFAVPCIHSCQGSTI